MLEVLLDRVNELKGTVSAAFRKFDELAVKVTELETQRRVEAERANTTALEQRNSYEATLDKSRREFETQAEKFAAQIGEAADPDDRQQTIHQRIDALVQIAEELSATQALFKKWLWRLAGGLLLAILQGEVDKKPFFAVLKASLGLGG